MINVLARLLALRNVQCLSLEVEKNFVDFCFLELLYVICAKKDKVEI